MDMIVCIKQVPSSSQVMIDEETGVMIRESAQTKMNPYDLYALEAAFLLREKHGGTVRVVTMGPPQAESVIKEAYFMGADDGWVISDRCFAGADVLATAYTISQGIRLLGRYDLIICGKQTTDGDTAQVGPAVAEFLDIPHVAWVNRFVDEDAGSITVQQDFPDTCETVRMPFPCLISVEPGELVPRLPSYKRMKETAKRPVGTLAFADFPDQDNNKYGLSGSPTKVVKMFPPETNDSHELWQGGGGELARRINGKLKELKFL